MKTKNKHKLINILLFKLSKQNYKAAYKTQISQAEYEKKGLPKYSLIDAMIDHLYGRKYYCVLITFPNQRVKGTNGKSIHEMSSSIFFSEEEAWAFYEEFHDDSKSSYINTLQIVSFRSKHKIPVWSGYRDNTHQQIY